MTAAPQVTDTHLDLYMLAFASGLASGLMADPTYGEARANTQTRQICRAMVADPIVMEQIRDTISALFAGQSTMRPPLSLFYDDEGPQ